MNYAWCIPITHNLYSPRPNIKDVNTGCYNVFSFKKMVLYIPPIYVHDFNTKLLILSRIKIDIGKRRDALIKK